MLTTESQRKKQKDSFDQKHNSKTDNLWVGPKEKEKNKAGSSWEKGCQLWVVENSDNSH